ncbi:MAG: FHA domain-containing protein [Agarilytica sp.]
MDDQTRIQTINRSRLALRADATGDVVELSGEMLIGREVDCGIQLSCPQVSRYHAKIYVSANGVFLEDLRSSNGTFINGKPIHSRTILSIGDHVMFDDLGYRVTSVNIDSADQTSLSNSQGISRAKVEQINEIAAQKLAPAPSTEQEISRERIEPISAPPESQQQNSSSPAGQPPKAKVHEIPDMDEFLRFAGSGLKPQEPMANRASPFGLGKQKAAESTEYSNDVESAENHKRKVHDISQVNFPRPMPLESESDQKEQLRVPSVAPKSRLQHEEEDKTSYLSLNKIDQYVSNNEQFQGELNVGSGPRLVVLTAPIRGKVFPLKSSEDVKCWSVGRDDSSDICLRDKAVSREHAWITKMDAIFQLRVNDNANDVFVNGRAVDEVELTHGDRLQLGTLALDFRIDESKSEPINMKNTRKKSSWVNKLFPFFKK